MIHSAEVALPGAEWTEAQLDKDDILAIWEIAGTLDGGEVEVDVRPDASVEEIEIIIEAGAVRAAAGSTSWSPTEPTRTAASTPARRTGGGGR